MSEKPSRTINEVQAEYGNLCTRAGHLQYQLYTFSKDLEAVNSTLRDLNLEAASIQAKEVKAAAEAKAETQAQSTGISLDAKKESETSNA